MIVEIYQSARKRTEAEKLHPLLSSARFGIRWLTEQIIGNCICNHPNAREFSKLARFVASADGDHPFRDTIQFW